MKTISELKYSATHQWVKEQDGVYTIGITDHAQSELGALVFVDLPEAGDTVEAGVSVGDVESTKVVAEVISPVSGKVLAVNDAVVDEPGLLNAAPYENWLIKVADVSDTVDLLTANEYRHLIEKTVK